MSSAISWSDPEAVEEHTLETVEQKDEQEQETVELYGKAQQLFDARARDSFTVERHGVEIEYLYPDSDIRQEFDAQRERVIRKAQQGADLTELLGESMTSIERMEQILSDHAVDESLQQPSVWRAGLSLTESEVGELFQDFINLGEVENQSEQLEQLASLMSDSSSSR